VNEILDTPVCQASLHQHMGGPPSTFGSTPELHVRFAVDPKRVHGSNKDIEAAPSQELGPRFPARSPITDRFAAFVNGDRAIHADK